MCMLPPDTTAFLCISPEIVEEQRIIHKTYNSEEVAKWGPKDFIDTLRILDSVYMRLTDCKKYYNMYA